jgi:arginine utilization regulatory protein
MPQELQAKLLRVLQDGRIRRVGDTKEHHVDVRIIAATNIEPNLAIEQGYIRRDLYYRLNTVTLWIPKLTDRKEDIPVLTQHFLRKYNGLLYRGIKAVSQEVMQLFIDYPWEGNVRELEHVIESAVNFVEKEVIEIQDLPYNLKKFYESASGHKRKSNRWTLTEDGLSATLETVEKHLIEDALDKYSGNTTQTAKALKVPRQTLQYKLKKLGIEP